MNCSYCEFIDLDFEARHNSTILRCRLSRPIVSSWWPALTVNNSRFGHSTSVCTSSTWSCWCLLFALFGKKGDTDAYVFLATRVRRAMFLKDPNELNKPKEASKTKENYPKRSCKWSQCMHYEPSWLSKHQIVFSCQRWCTCYSNRISGHSYVVRSDAVDARNKWPVTMVDSVLNLCMGTNWCVPHPTPSPALAALSGVKPTSSMSSSRTMIWNHVWSTNSQVRCSYGRCGKYFWTFFTCLLLQK